MRRGRSSTRQWGTVVYLAGACWAHNHDAKFTHIWRCSWVVVEIAELSKMVVVMMMMVCNVGRMYSPTSIIFGRRSKIPVICFCFLEKKYPAILVLSYRWPIPGEEPHGFRPQAAAVSPSPSTSLAASVSRLANSVKG